MGVREFEQRKPANVAYTRMKLRKNEVVRAEGVVLDLQGHTTNMKLLWDREGRAFARWMVQGLPTGDVFADGWKYLRMEKYDLKENKL